MEYLAYGSNLNKEQMKRRCPTAKVVGIGYITGYKLVFNTFLTIEKTGNKKDKVPVGIWDVTEEDERRLDIYEGYPNHYTKAVTSSGAFVYIMNRKGKNAPSQYYYDVCAKGYEDFGLDIKYLEKAMKEVEK